MVKNILKFAEIFSKKAQVLPFGASSGYESELLNNKLESFKHSIETMAKGTEPRVGWSHPGAAALEAINKKLSGQILSPEEITNAGNDVRTNFRVLDADALVQALSVVSV